MKILYKIGPKAGTVAHVPHSQEIEVLLNAGIIEQIQELIPKAQVTWGIHRGHNTQRISIVATCSREVCTRFIYDGRPEFATRHPFLHSCGHVSPEPVPEEIVKRYAEARSGTAINIGADEEQMYHTQNHIGSANKRRPVNHGSVNGKEWVEQY